MFSILLPVCDICGQSVAMFMCGRCDNKQLCTACDERWHQHPKRKNHDRQKLRVPYLNLDSDSQKQNIFHLQYFFFAHEIIISSIWCFEFWNYFCRCQVQNRTRMTMNICQPKRAMLLFLHLPHSKHTTSCHKKYCSTPRKTPPKISHITPPVNNLHIV